MALPNALKNIDNTWKSIGIILGILGAGIFGWNYTMAQVKETAQTEVQATVNKEMIDGAKKAAKEAVTEAMAEQKAEMKKIVKEAAKEAAKEVIRQQKETP
jgi:hypothetical protein